MHLTVIGATGMVGTRLVREAVRRGDTVTAASRHPRESSVPDVVQLDSCVAHPHQEWTYLSPPAVLAPGTRTGMYRRGTSTLLPDADGMSRISVEDLAVAALDEAERPGTDRHFTVVRADHNRVPTEHPIKGLRDPGD